MSEEARNVLVGTVNGGATPINADVTSIGSDVPVAVVLLTNYAMLNPPGYPFRASFTGAATPQYPHTITSGSTIRVLRCEATALVNAGAATLV